MGLTAGTRLGQYQIVASIGAGGMGEVYRARDTRLGRDVAVLADGDRYLLTLWRYRRSETVK